MEHDRPLPDEPGEGLRRRRFLGFLVSAPTPAVAVQLPGEASAKGRVPARAGALAGP